MTSNSLVKVPADWTSDTKGMGASVDLYVLKEQGN